MSGAGTRSESERTHERRSCEIWFAASVVALALLASGLGCAGASALGSIGVVLGRDPETRALHVRDLPEGTDALDPELLPGDEVLMVDGVYVRDLSTKELRAKLRGEPGSTVRLTVIRGREVLRLEVRRVALREGKPAPSEERVGEE